MLTIAQILSKYGPALTSEVAARLRRSGLSPEAARQRLSRLPDGVLALRGISFPKRVRFIYLESQWGKDVFWSALIAAIKATNPAYAAAIAAMRARGGIIPTRHFGIVSGAPVRQTRQVASDLVLDRLMAIQLLKQVNVAGEGECVTLNDYIEPAQVNSHSLRARLLTEKVLLDALRQWAGRMNMASPRATRIRDEEPAPQFSTCKFDLCGPSYLRPLTRFQDGKPAPGFLVADVVVGTTLNEDAAAAFVRKCEMLTHLKKVRPFMPLLISDNFTSEALHLCRSKGIMATRPATLFGDDVARALGDLLQTLSNAAAVVAANPERLQNIFDRLMSIEGAAGNLRGALFELIVGHLVKELVGGSIDIGISVTDPKTGDNAEIDVRLVKQRDLTFYECKGYQPSSQLRVDEIEDWLMRRIPRIVSYHRNEDRFRGGGMTFEFWTCGTFSIDALRMLSGAAAKTKKYKIAWKDGQAVRAFARRMAAPGIVRILDEHYFNHPLAKLRKPSRPGRVRAPSQTAKLEAEDGEIDLEAAE